jgi:hypothetical protein
MPSWTIKQTNKKKKNSPPPIYLDNGDFPMGKAGPSGVDHDTTQPTHANAAGNHDDYGLSMLRRSHHITDYVDRGATVVGV